ncbi:hypothetical protein ABBQ38_007651 [Trebouxia sp. C0009 RCD-2024]
MSLPVHIAKQLALRDVKKRLQSTGLTYRYTLAVGDGHISKFSVAGKTKALDTGKAYGVTD